MNPIAELLEDLRAKLPAASRVITEGGGADTSQASLAAPLEVVRRAVAAIPNTSNHFPSRESYVQLGYAIKAALPDDEPAAFELFSEWCGRWTDGVNEPDVIEADWRRMKPPFKRGASWLIELAAERSDVVAWFEPIPDEPEPIWPTTSESPTPSIEAIKWVRPSEWTGKKPPEREQSPRFPIRWERTQFSNCVRRAQRDQERRRLVRIGC